MSWFSRFFPGAHAPLAQPLTPVQQQSLERWRQLPAPDLTRPHYQTRYVVVDVESSGLDMNRDRLISIGAVAVVNGVIDGQDVFETILRQEEVSTTDNILIHGIGGSAQREGIDPPDALLAFLDYCAKAPLVAYHSVFDQTMIDRALQRYLGTAAQATWIDLAWVMPDLFRERIDAQVSLDSWLEQFGIENIQRHNAVSDALATAMLLQAAIARGASRGAKSAASFVDTEKSRRWMRRYG